MGYLEEPLRTYSDALVGALGAALDSMVANFTVGREKFADVDAEVRDLLARSERLRSELERLVQADTEAYGGVAAAQKMPRQTDEEKTARTAAMQEALKQAAEVPRAAVRACHGVIEVAAALVDKGNPNLITDVGVAARFALAAMECAVLNVEINLIYIKDKAYVDACLDAMKPLIEEGERVAKQVWHRVIQHMREGAKR
jgi:formiminotetrahydrofolate cyclodeaminase